MSAEHSFSLPFLTKQRHCPDLVQVPRVWTASPPGRFPRVKLGVKQRCFPVGQRGCAGELIPAEGVVGARPGRLHPSLVPARLPSVDWCYLNCTWGC